LSNSARRENASRGGGLLLPSATTDIELEGRVVEFNDVAVEPFEVQFVERVTHDRHYGIDTVSPTTHFDWTEHHPVNGVSVLPIEFDEVRGSDNLVLVQGLNHPAVIQLIVVQAGKPLSYRTEIGRKPPAAELRQISASLAQV
jgi:hypothetical protein